MGIIRRRTRMYRKASRVPYERAEEIEEGRVAVRDDFVEIEKLHLIAKQVYYLICILSILFWCAAFISSVLSYEKLLEASVAEQYLNILGLSSTIISYLIYTTNTFWMLREERKRERVQHGHKKTSFMPTAVGISHICGFVESVVVVALCCIALDLSFHNRNSKLGICIAALGGIASLCSLIGASSSLYNMRNKEKQENNTKKLKAPVCLVMACVALSATNVGLCITQLASDVGKVAGNPFDGCSITRLIIKIGWAAVFIGTLLLTNMAYNAKIKEDRRRVTTPLASITNAEKSSKKGSRLLSSILSDRSKRKRAMLENRKSFHIHYAR